MDREARVGMIGGGGGYSIARLAEVDATECPCGLARRAFVGSSESPASVHLVDIAVDARVHYHRIQTEIYYILEGDDGAFLELDGERVAVKVGDAVLIRPGCRHRAVGRLRILNIVVPPFDPDDEWFD